MKPTEGRHTAEVASNFIVGTLFTEEGELLLGVIKEVKGEENEF